MINTVKNIHEVVITGNDLTLEQLVAVARYDAKITIDADAAERIKASRAIVDKIVNSGAVVYGITTGFGSLCRVHISKEDCSQLQENLIRTTNGSAISRISLS